MEYTRYTAKTKDEAITKACLDLGVTSDRLEYRVVQEATNGFLGIGSKPAIIEAGLKQEKTSKEAAPVKNEKVEKAPVKKTSEPEKQELPEQESKADQIITSDEIEKRAALAAMKSDQSGEEDTEQKKERSGRDRHHDRRKRDRHARGSEKVRVPHEPSKPKPERVVTPKSEEEVAAMIQSASTFLSNVFEAMHIEVQMSFDYHQEDGSLNVSFVGEEMGILIGKRGQTLDSLQYLTSLVVNKGKSEYIRVKLDTEDYRTRRAETLHNLARNIAFKVKKTRRPVSLEPMNPYERRIIHSSLQNNKFVETYSEGEEPYRHVVVAPKRW